MNNNAKNKLAKERFVMIMSSVFVLAALTLTGVYMRKQSKPDESDGYTIDLSAMEKTAAEKAEEIAKKEAYYANLQAQLSNSKAGSAKEKMEEAAPEDELDYMPLEEALEVDSNQIVLPKVDKKPKMQKEKEPEIVSEEIPYVEVMEEAPYAEAIAENEMMSNALVFDTAASLQPPVQGEILLPYSMEQSIYFQTLDQYRYHPAVVFSAPQGSPVYAVANGYVEAVSRDAQLGETLSVNMGDNYKAIYGQLCDITVAEGSYVEQGSVLGYVAEPTKYYCLEGPNLYFAMKQGDTPINPMQYLP